MKWDDLVISMTFSENPVLPNSKDIKVGHGFTIMANPETALLTEPLQDKEHLMMQALVLLLEDYVERHGPTTTKMESTLDRGVSIHRFEMPYNYYLRDADGKWQSVSKEEYSVFLSKKQAISMKRFTNIKELLEKLK